MKYDYKVTVIIPIYNADKFIRKNLESLVNQTIDSKEIICVNDGSTDKTLSILNEFSDKYEFVKVINQPNSQCAVARNNGLVNAKGEYIYFIDADDYTDITLLEKTYNHAKRMDADIVLFDGFAFDNNTGKILKRDYLSTQYLPTSEEVFSGNIKNIFQVINTATFTKLYSHDYIKNNNLYFANYRNAEDIYFFVTSLVSAKKITYINEKLVYYRTNIGNSLTDSFSISKSFVVDSLSDAYDYLKSNGYYSQKNIELSFNLHILTHMEYQIRLKKYKSGIVELMSDFVSSNLREINYNYIFDYSRGRDEYLAKQHSMFERYLISMNWINNNLKINKTIIEKSRLNYLENKFLEYDFSIIIMNDKYLDETKEKMNFYECSKFELIDFCDYNDMTINSRIKMNYSEKLLYSICKSSGKYLFLIENGRDMSILNQLLERKEYTTIKGDCLVFDFCDDKENKTENYVSMVEVFLKNPDIKPASDLRVILAREFYIKTYVPEMLSGINNNNNYSIFLKNIPQYKCIEYNILNIYEESDICYNKKNLFDLYLKYLTLNTLVELLNNEEVENAFIEYIINSIEYLEKEIQETFIEYKADDLVIFELINEKDKFYLNDLYINSQILHELAESKRNIQIMAKEQLNAMNEYSEKYKDFESEIIEIKLKYSEKIQSLKSNNIKYKNELKSIKNSKSYKILKKIKKFLNVKRIQ